MPQQSVELQTTTPAAPPKSHCTTDSLCHKTPARTRRMVVRLDPTHPGPSTAQSFADGGHTAPQHTYTSVSMQQQGRGVTCMYEAVGCYFGDGTGVEQSTRDLQEGARLVVCIRVPSPALQRSINTNATCIEFGSTHLHKHIVLQCK